MANYVPWHGKKREHLIEHERVFVALLLQSDADASKVADAAENVRMAKVRALKSKRAELPPSEKNAVAIEKLDREIAFWLALPIQEIVDGYRTGKWNELRFAAVGRAIR